MPALIDVPLGCFPATMAASDGEMQAALQRDLDALHPSWLPLAQALRHGSMPVDGSHRALVCACCRQEGCIHARVMLMFQSVDAGCACEGDPSGTVPTPECADLEIRIDCNLKRARIRLL